MPRYNRQRTYGEVYARNHWKPSLPPPPPAASLPVLPVSERVLAITVAPSTRAGDDDRDVYLSALARAHAEGFIDRDELGRRQDYVLTAVTKAELPRVTSDLPAAVFMPEPEALLRPHTAPSKRGGTALGDFRLLPSWKPWMWVLLAPLWAVPFGISLLVFGVSPASGFGNFADGFTAVIALGFLVHVLAVIGR